MWLREIFPKIMDKKVTYSNLQVILWKGKKYATELIPVKSYMKGLTFLMTKTLKDIANHSLNVEKVFSQWYIPFKANAPLYSSASHYTGFIKVCKKYASPNLIILILQTKRFIIYLNCTVFIETAVKLMNA